MAGTDHRRRPTLGGPAVILVDPQLGENIGTAARAMLNCGLVDLRLVRPRESWPNAKAVSAAAGADRVVRNARLFDTTEEAVADLDRLYACTARSRDMVQRVVTARGAAGEMRDALAQGERCGVIFGPERSGLVNDDVALADAALNVPLNPAFSSLNLAQAVLVVAYEWFQAGAGRADSRLRRCGAKPASKSELLGLFRHLEAELDASGFFEPVEKRPIMARNIRNIFQRAGLMDFEVRTLHGIVTALAGRVWRRKPPESETDERTAPTPRRKAG